jgi:putative toxin-antitoxin system antitoxin component (TIGR02293 family)
MSTNVEMSQPIPQLDTFKLIQDARRGVPAAKGYALADSLGLNLEEVSDLLGITSKTLRSYRDSGKPLSASLSEQVIKLAYLIRWGLDVFGTPQNLQKWLKSPATGLDEMIPMELLKTGTGIDLVTNAIQQIAYGDLS